MMTPNPRALRLALLAAAIFAGAFSFANSASAQWSDPVCVDPNTVPGVFEGYTFNGAVKCESYCKMVASNCKSLVKDAASCNQNSWKGYWNLFDKASCDVQENPQDRKDCNAMVKGQRSLVHGEIDSSKDMALDACDMNLANCIANCALVL
ncbi:MAG TPA: hypothetical protein VMR86_17695 [Myxococcota bacterium]|nr:hypothetical protein [Myxococcota bacterium]